MRLYQKVETFWRAKNTPLSERHHVSFKLNQILDAYMIADRSKQSKILYLIEQYIIHMK